MQIELTTIPLYLYAMCSINPECEEAEKKAREAEKKAREAEKKVREAEKKARETENAVEAGETWGDADEAKENAKEAKKNADDARKSADEAKKNTKEAKRVFRSVVSQEMLHLSLAGNVLLAIGGQPKLYDRDGIPKFPELLPYRKSPLKLNLRPATKDHIRDTFMKLINVIQSMQIEESEYEEGKIEALAASPVVPYKTIGLFYEYIKVGLHMTQFPRDTRIGCQFTPDQSEYASPHAAHPKNGLVVVSDREIALKAIEIIVTQGEGNLAKNVAKDDDKCSRSWCIALDLLGRLSVSRIPHIQEITAMKRSRQYMPSSAPLYVCIRRSI
ncbi:ferritin-like-domain-containing protein [Jimgerdemannia flammicorona]|uniref:Ferritin-like-domain-containing protein n=1 Tax=Jimgerdemannia flammicorona TaxID=994334 RepID=A0A433PV13_9FUNG|nr:ferritin-like-domain-containing protein [Jimgerdemannia flammicorona]